jgi:hypothetical protein
LFVGMAPAAPLPSKNTAPTIKRLHEWARAVGVHVFSFVNASHAVDLVPDLEFLRGACVGADRVVALGALASRSLDEIGVKHFRLPHPSGRNRLLNDAAYVRRCLAACQRYVSG